MKTAIYIEDGRTQFVLTPETEIDKKVLAEIENTQLKTYRGKFYACQGGWTQQGNVYQDFYGRETSTDSLIFVIDRHNADVAQAVKSPKLADPLATWEPNQ